MAHQKRKSVFVADNICGNIVVEPSRFDFLEFELIPIQKRKAGNQGNNKKLKYKDIVCAFDIETTRIPAIEQSVMYVWQFQVGLHHTVVGRTWEEFTEFCRRLTLGLGENEYIVVYVHNLSYEFQFLRGVYQFQQDEVFAVKSRRVLRCEMLKHIEFRCSYLHSNMSLGEYLEKMQVEHRKKSGILFDYDKPRYPWTPLSDFEMDYAISDVLGLVEAIYKEMALDGDNLYSIPLTSTGYVRRDVKRAVHDEISHTYISDQLPNYAVYELLREEFRGGNTHANRFFSGKILTGVGSWDRVSSYPDVLVNCLYPVSDFRPTKADTIDDINHLVKKRKKAVLFRIALHNVRLSYEFWGCPYLSKDKSRNVVGGVYDNGRILSADYLETTVNDIDFEIIQSEYSWDKIEIFDCYSARYGKLHNAIVKVILKYFTEKTELKGIDEMEVYYGKIKNKFNAIYGMMAQNPVKQSIDFRDNDFIERNEDLRELLDRHNKKAFLSYAWGAWCTAWARLRLEEGIRIAGDQFVYADTDSVKHLGEIDFSAYNQLRISDSVQNGAVAKDRMGKTHYLGVYEQEKTACEFKTLGAKKYVCRYNPDSPLITTIAGVTKKSKNANGEIIYPGGAELEAAGGIAAYREGFIFRTAGGTESVYNDEAYGHYVIDGHTINITANVVIRPSTYTVGITGEYERLLRDCETIKIFSKIVENRY